MILNIFLLYQIFANLKRFVTQSRMKSFVEFFKRVKTLRCDGVLLLFPSRTRSENEKSRQQKCQNCVKTFLTSNVVLKNIVFHSKKRITQNNKIYKLSLTAENNGFSINFHLQVIKKHNNVSL